MEVSLADYEAHMASAAVDQATALSALFAEALELRKPESVAILGIAGGNGLESIDSGCTHRIVGIDLNPDYLQAAQARFSALPGLELHAIDLSHAKVALEPVALVHAALIFEHAGTDGCLENALALVASNGAFSVVLQIPGETSANVGDSGVESVKKFAGHFSLIDRGEFIHTLANRGFELRHEKLHPVPAGKQLWLGVFVRS
ncbi:MAG TPA: class I SAM-dependent methyltransferase [Terracidiphilus sp.]|nr:class I SAM-dependent methyltransferase [Terracidiphilus sp.]